LNRLVAAIIGVLALVYVSAAAAGSQIGFAEQDGWGKSLKRRPPVTDSAGHRSSSL